MSGRRLGSVIRVRRTKGVGQLNNPNSFMGAVGAPLLGAFAAGLTAIGLRMMTPKTEGQMKLMENAPWIGGLVGSIAAALVGVMSGRAAGWGAAAGSTAVSTAMIASEAAAKSRMQAPQPQAGLRGRARTGAIVMEPHGSRGYGAGPLGAIVPEYGSRPGNTRGLGAYGDQVNVRGVNARAFGTPGFAMSGRR